MTHKCHNFFKSEDFWYMVQNYASHVKTVMIIIEKKDERHNRGKIPGFD